MGVREQVFTRATTHAGLKALIVKRCYPRRLPENVVLPAIVYTVVTRNPEEYNDHDGNHDRERSTVQFTVHASTSDGAETLANQVVAAFNGWSNGSAVGWCWNVSRFESQELSINTFSQILDFRIDHLK